MTALDDVFKTIVTEMQGQNTVFSSQTSRCLFVDCVQFLEQLCQQCQVSLFVVCCCFGMFWNDLFLYFFVCCLDGLYYYYPSQTLSQWKLKSRKILWNLSTISQLSNYLRAHWDDSQIKISQISRISWLWSKLFIYI